MSLNHTHLVNLIWFKVVCVDELAAEVKLIANGSVDDDGDVDDDVGGPVFDKGKHLSVCCL